MNTSNLTYWNDILKIVHLEKLVLFIFYLINELIEGESLTSNNVQLWILNISVSNIEKTYSI